MKHRGLTDQQETCYTHVRPHSDCSSKADTLEITTQVTARSIWLEIHHNNYKSYTGHTYTYLALAQPFFYIFHITA